MINSILIEGRIVKQPEIKALDNEKQTKIAVFSIAHHNIKMNVFIFLFQVIIQFVMQQRSCKRETALQYKAD